MNPIDAFPHILSYNDFIGNKFFQMVKDVVNLSVKKDFPSGKGETLINIQCTDGGIKHSTKDEERCLNEESTLKNFINLKLVSTKTDQHGQIETANHDVYLGYIPMMGELYHKWDRKGAGSTNITVAGSYYRR